MDAGTRIILVLAVPAVMGDHERLACQQGQVNRTEIHVEHEENITLFGGSPKTASRRISQDSIRTRFLAPHVWRLTTHGDLMTKARKTLSS